MWIDATMDDFVRDQPEDFQVSRQIGFALAPNAKVSARTPTGCGLESAPSPPDRRKSRAAEKCSPRPPARTTSSWSRRRRCADVPPARGPRAVPESRLSKVGPLRQARRWPRSTPPIRTSQACSRCPTSGCHTPRFSLKFQGIGATGVGQQFSAALDGLMTVDAALAAAQSATEREMKRAGYIKWPAPSVRARVPAAPSAAISSPVRHRRLR